LIPNAGNGLFASEKIPSDKLLGCYPGNVVLKDVFIVKKKNLSSSPGQYVWIFEDSNVLLDPTDDNGYLKEYVPAGNVASFLPFSETLWKVVGKVSEVVPFLPFSNRETVSKSPTTICLINEPPLGSDCNVRISVCEKENRVEFLSSREIDSGEELYVDYGSNYDRTTYVTGDSRKWNFPTVSHLQDRRNFASSFFLPALASITSGALFPSVTLAVTIDVNNAVAREYSTLPGLFPTIASKLCKRGPFKSKKEMYASLDSEEERERLKKYDSSLKIAKRDAGVMQFKASQICKYECRGGTSEYQNKVMRDLQRERRY